MRSKTSPWQASALEAGRTPLPDAPGQRPWLITESKGKVLPKHIGATTEQKKPREAEKSSRPQKRPSDFVAFIIENPGPGTPSHRDHWSSQEIRDLLDMKAGKRPRSEIMKRFHYRSPRAISLAAWKHKTTARAAETNTKRAGSERLVPL
ncbi:hypothetical protein HJFPF1_09948 [Paramyrothecium foliicola]|nr:hypothetical protein HJFPF1_09948 [Paramyrothecium foliicola]